MAKRTVSQLNVKITASAEGMRRGVGTAKREMKSLGTTSTSALKSVGVAAGVTAAAVAGIALAARKVVTVMLEVGKQADELIKRSRTLGAEMSELRDIRILSEFSGADATKATTAMERLLMAVGDAKDGTGEAAEAFRDLGLNVAEIREMGAAELFEETGKALSGIRLRSDQLDILGSLIGRRQAAEMLQPFLAAAGGIDNVSEAMGKFGTLSKEQQANIEEMIDAVTFLIAGNKELWMQLVADLAPALTEAALAAAEFLAQIRPWIPTIANAIKSVARFALEMSPLVHIVRGVIAAMKALGLVTDKEVAEAFRKAREPAEAFRDTIATIPVAIEKAAMATTEVVDDTASKIERLKDELAGMAEVATDSFSFTPTAATPGRRSNAALSAINAATRNRIEDLRRRKAEEKEREKRDDRRDKILSEIRILTERMMRAAERGVVEVRETAIVG